ncbi:MAG: SOS response-associated peptidase [Gammaproteobacteria bacterium]
MCGRYALISDATELAEAFGVEMPPVFAPRYNIAPSQPVLIVRASERGREADIVEWGLLPSWSKDPRSARRPINARAETVAEKPSFRAAWRRRRCLVPANGYYEWAKRPGGKQPYYIHRRDDAPFAIAGIWEAWERDGNRIESCALLTCAASERLAAVHDRMPVTLAPAAYALWLGEASDGDAAALLTPAPDDAFELRAVSTRVNAPANDSPECLEPLADADD